MVAVGVLNWPLPEEPMAPLTPSYPAPIPSRKLPLLSNFCTRLLYWSATQRLPLASKEMSFGKLNGPLPLPSVPNYMR